MWKPVYYADHAERYADLSEDERREYPDEIHFIGIGSNPPIIRKKKLSEMTAEDRKEYGPDGILFAAVDVPLSRAEVWH